MISVRDKLINVTGGMGSSISYLTIGDDKTVLLDCGMAYCAKNLINNIKLALPPDRRLNYVLLSHSHYDHIGAVPCIRKQWPEVRILGAEYASHILQKPKALKIIKDLASQASVYYGNGDIADYDDSLLKVDQVVSDGFQIDLGGTAVTILETPGHTKCSLSFLINDEILYASETTGVANKAGVIFPTFISSLKQAETSLEKCKNVGAKHIIEAHNGFVKNTEGYWDRCMEAIEWVKDFVNGLQAQGADEDKIYNEFKGLALDDSIKSIQPVFAFEINNRAMIRTIMHNK